ncbi:UNVERIFIED_ORG: DNA invertase Pin-like site-specific DNA recombinase [Rhizobium esperanzae]
MKPIAYSYVRFSTPEQIDGDSLRRQMAGTIKWCKDNDVELDTALTFHDLGRSGFTGANFDEGALGSFFALVRDGTIKRGSFLVLEELDRFSRENPYIAAGKLFDLVKAGITVVAVRDNDVYSAERLGGSDPLPLMMLVLKLSQGHMESAKKSFRGGEVWAEKKRAARNERIPITRRCPEWLYVEDGQFRVNEERQSVVKRIFRETIAGFGRRKIVEQLNAENVPAFRGKRGWQTSSVQKIIKGKAVLGEYQPHLGRHKAKNRRPEGEPIEGYYPAVIDEQMYWQAQAAVEGRKHGSAGRIGTNGAHFLKGLAKCGECNGVMHIVNKGSSPKGGVYYVCDNAKRKMGCDNGKHYRVDETERLVLQVLSQFLAGEIDLKRSEAAKISDVEVLNAQLKDREAVRQRLLKLVEVAEFDDELTERFRSTALHVRELKAKLKTAKAELKIARADYDIETRRALLDELMLSISSDASENVVATKVKLNSIIRRFIEPVIFSRVPGVELTIRTWHFNNVGTDGTFMTKDVDGGGMTILLEEQNKISDEAFAAFYGQSRESWDAIFGD